MTQAPVSSSGIGVVGAGRLGSCLALALSGAGHRITRVASASESSARALAERLPGAAHTNAEAVVEGTQLVFLTVPDAALGALADRLPWRSGQQVVHCSGALGLDVLQAVARAGAERGCLHPLQAFPERYAKAKRFSGIMCGVEADGVLLPRLVRLCADFGAGVVPLAGVDRAGYHAAAVFASNYVVALRAAAARAWALAGLPPELAQGALSALTEGAVEHLRGLPLEAALTGPLARGDVDTIARHLAALAGDPELSALYRGLGALLMSLPLALSMEQRAALSALLERR
jgi:predicted short-subunit dehydrogenase-like oxidoreductase (DUF2520 family)